MANRASRPVHGSLRATDATTAQSVQLYKAGTLSTTAVGADEYLEVTDLLLVTAVATDIRFYIGTSGTPAAGEDVVRGDFAARGGIAKSFVGSPRRGAKASTPRVLAGAVGVVNVNFTGILTKLPPLRSLYVVRRVISRINSPRTLMLLSAPSGVFGELVSASVTRRTPRHSELEVMSCSVERVATLGTPTGVAVSPAKVESGDSAATITALANVTDGEPAYDPFCLDEQGVEVAGGYLYAPEGKPVLAPSESIGLRLLAAPATPFDAVVEMCFAQYFE